MCVHAWSARALQNHEESDARRLPRLYPRRSSHLGSARHPKRRAALSLSFARARAGVCVCVCVPAERSRYTQPRRELRAQVFVFRGAAATLARLDTRAPRRVLALFRSRSRGLCVCMCARSARALQNHEVRDARRLPRLFLRRGSYLGSARHPRAAPRPRALSLTLARCVCACGRGAERSRSAEPRRE